MKMSRMWIAAAAAPVLALGVAGAQAQSCSGTPGANTICAGPSSGGSGFPGFRALVPADLPGGSSSALLDAIGSTRGSVLERAATAWGIIAPGTAGLPFVSNGAGADPGYQALTGAGIAAATITSAKISPPLSVAVGGTGDTGTAWTSFTSSPVCLTGSGTWSVTSARFKTIGKTVFVSMEVTLTAVGSCSGNFWNFTLPVTAAAASALAGQEIAVNGATSQCSIRTSNLTIAFCSSGIALATGDHFDIGGVYESQ